MHTSAVRRRMHPASLARIFAAHKTARPISPSTISSASTSRMRFSRMVTGSGMLEAQRLRAREELGEQRLRSDLRPRAVAGDANE